MRNNFKGLFYKSFIILLLFTAAGYKSIAQTYPNADPTMPAGVSQVDASGTQVAPPLLPVTKLLVQVGNNGNQSDNSADIPPRGVGYGVVLPAGVTFKSLDPSTDFELDYYDNSGGLSQPSYVQVVPKVTLPSLYFDGFVLNVQIDQASSNVQQFSTQVFRINPAVADLDPQNNVTYTDYAYPTTISGLPVSLTSFNAVADGQCNVAVSWATASEVNSKDYTVEYSSNGGSSFKAVAVTASHNATAGAQYSTTISSSLLQQGTAILRLKMTDKDGSVKYSSYKSITIGCNTATITVAPNPVVNTIHVKGLTGTSIISLYNPGGQRVAVIKTANTTQVINAAPLAQGVYQLRITDEKGNTKASIKVIK